MTPTEKVEETPAVNKVTEIGTKEEVKATPVPQTPAAQKLNFHIQEQKLVWHSALQDLRLQVLRLLWFARKKNNKNKKR